MFNRTVDLQKYLPPVIGDAKEIQEMNRVESEELTRVWEASETMFYNRWILTADEVGLRRYEDLLAIVPSGDLDARRKTAHFEWNKNIVYTDRSLRKLLAQLYGESGFFMEILYDQYIVHFALIVPSGAPNLDEAYRRIRAIIPANMGIEFAIQSQSEIYIQTSYRFFAWKYAMCGEPECGTLPYTATKGLSFENYLGADIVLEGRMQPLRRVSKRSIMMPHELIYPVELRDRMMVIDGGNAKNMMTINKTVQSGEVI